MYVRADGNSKIGMGHIMRCLSIAKEIMSRGYDVKFLIASKDSADVLEKEHIPYLILETDYTDMLSEKKILDGILTDGDKILVDSYYVNAEYFEWLKKKVTVFYMDDVHSFEYQADMIINGNIYGIYENYGNVYALGGCKYTPLRAEYREARLNRKPERILITTGSSDPYNITESIANVMINDPILCQTGMDIVCGKYNEAYERLRNLEKICPNIKVHRNVPNMWELMKNAMLAITAGGSTLNELSCLGVPIICFSFVENQERIVQVYNDEGYAHLGGAWSQGDEEFLNKICIAAKELLADEKLRDMYSSKLMQLVDGRGCERIAEKIINF